MSFNSWSKARYANAVKHLFCNLPDIANNWKHDYVDKEIIIKKYSSENYYWWLDELDYLFQRAQTIGVAKSIIIHGSYGDNTDTKFSDIDLTILLTNDVFTNEKTRKLTREWIAKELNPLLVRIDPLQHHGAFFLWEGLVNNYNEMILPLSSYRDSWALNDLSLKFRVPELPNSKEQHISFISTASRLLEPEKYFFKYGTNPYSIKRLISNFILIPAFYYQSQGIILNKQDAILKIKEELGVDSVIYQGIISATSLRDEWPASPSWLGFLRSKIIKDQIPGNRFDHIALSIYRNKIIESKFKSEFINILPSACQYFLKMGEQ